jgi:LacI family transcriptional regulator
VLRLDLKAFNDCVNLSHEYIQEATFDQQSGYAQAMLLLRLIPQPTAILAANDMIAFGALRAIHESGLCCPEQVPLVGFDNLDFAEAMSPPLSSVSQPGYQMGSIAAGLLIDRVRGNVGLARHIVLETSLKIRESVAEPLPAAKKRRKTAPSTPYA